MPVIKYLFDLSDQSISFDINLNETTLLLENGDQETLPEWTRLGVSQCRNCPLSEAESKVCPVAVNLAPLVRLVSTLDSYRDVAVSVMTEQRTISAQTTVQRGVSSLLGLIMATSACPHTALLRPMARFHLPFSTEMETIYRAASSYLLAQYILAKRGGKPDLELSGLKSVYESLQVVNRALAQRLRSASERDAPVNAIILLDLFAKEVPHSIDDILEGINYMYKPYLESLIPM